MDQLAPALARSLIGAQSKTATKNLILNSAQALRLQSALDSDAKGAIYSGLVSLADALNGLERKAYSWATVKLYYAGFYFARAALARRGHLVFYVQSYPFKLCAFSGQSPVNQAGNSHSISRVLYKSFVPEGAMNSQPIGNDYAFDWLAYQREQVNYREARMFDPEVPAWFKRVSELGVRKLITAYLSDLSLYAFDPDHAQLALPLAVLKDEKSSMLRFPGLGLTDEDMRIIKAMLKDGKGPLPMFDFI